MKLPFCKWVDETERAISKAVSSCTSRDWNEDFISRAWLRELTDAFPRVHIEGEYNGTFTITYHVGTDSARTETGAVEFSFDDGRYDVDGEQRYLPPRGGGKYTIGSSINLTDRELHTAEFDWSLILNGSFDYEMKENTR